MLEDVGLVWKNCRTFNAEGSDIHAMADEAEAHFVQLWAKKELPFEPADLSKSSSEPRKHASVHLLTGTSLMRTYTHTVLCRLRHVNVWLCALAASTLCHSLGS